MYNELDGQNVYTSIMEGAYTFRWIVVIYNVYY